MAAGAMAATAQVVQARVDLETATAGREGAGRWCCAVPLALAGTQFRQRALWPAQHSTDPLFLSQTLHRPPDTKTRWCNRPQTTSARASATAARSPAAGACAVSSGVPGRFDSKPSSLAMPPRDRCSAPELLSVDSLTARVAAPACRRNGSRLRCAFPLHPFLS
jgi:hypothetical protein